MLLTLILPPLEEQRPIELHPWIYPSSRAPSSGDYATHTFFANRHPAGDWPRRYTEELLSKTGMGARCVSPDVYPNLEPCTDAAPDVANFSTPVSVLDRMELAECNCDVGTQQCPAE